MNEVKFIDYKPTPSEKYHGIMTVLVNGMIYLRYKIISGKNGGYYPNGSSYKVSENGADTYISSFLIESNMLKEQVESCLKVNINRVMGLSASAFQQPKATQSTYQVPQQTQYAPIQEEIPF